jgi:C4-dicarboxylate-specific signal transduction histidine kinase
VAAVAEDVTSTPLFHSEEEVAATRLLEDVGLVLEDARKTLAQVTAMLGPAKEIGRIADVLEPDLKHLQDELAQFSELAGLGMTAEALSHEISIIADGLSARTMELSSRLKGQIRETDTYVVAFTEHVQTAVNRIRKQLSHLDPSMRYVRERRDAIRIGDLCKEMHDFYNERLARSRIQISLADPFDNFTVLMNKGKLIQVLDNLILNSEYWLRDDLKTRQISEAIIHMQSASPYLDISDSGIGISPSVEHYLFQPFVTTKPQGVGRGLGLFIARQLLESSGCAISLLPIRNQYDRRYVFRIDFTGALHV